MFIKRKILASAAITVTVLTACDGGGAVVSVPEYSRNFSFDAVIACGEFSETATFSRKGENDWEVHISEPYSLQGIEIGMSGDDTTVSFDGMTVDTNNYDGVSHIVTKVFDCLSDKEGLTAERNGDIVMVEGICDNYTFLLNTDGKVPLSILIGDIDFTAEISDFKFAEQS